MSRHEASSGNRGPQPVILTDLDLPEQSGIGRAAYPNGRTETWGGERLKEQLDAFKDSLVKPLVVVSGSDEAVIAKAKQITEERGASFHVAEHDDTGEIRDDLARWQKSIKVMATGGAAIEAVVLSDGAVPRNSNRMMRKFAGALKKVEESSGVVSGVGNYLPNPEIDELNRSQRLRNFGLRVLNLPARIIGRGTTWHGPIEGVKLDQTAQERILATKTADLAPKDRAADLIVTRATDEHHFRGGVIGDLPATRQLAGDLSKYAGKTTGEIRTDDERRREQNS